MAVVPSKLTDAKASNFGLGDAGGVIMLRRQWERVTTLNGRNMGTLYSQLKKLRNDINRKMRGLVGKDMVTEAWLCMEVLSLLPSEFWGGSISMTEEWFSVENVEVNLGRVFGDRSKKAIDMMSEKRRPTVVNVAKTFTGKKRTQAESSETRSRDYFYCSEDSHWKKDWLPIAILKDPVLFRSNIKTAPGAKKKRAMTVKKDSKSTTEKDTGNDDEEMTPGEKLAADNQLETELKEADEFEFKERVPPSEGSENKAPMNPMNIDGEQLNVTNSLWVVDTGAGHGISSDRKWFSRLSEGQTHLFEYGNGGTSSTKLQGTVYYLPSKQLSSNTRVLSVCTQLDVQKTLKEWHLRLGHVGKGRLMNILAGRVIKDAPHLSRREMENVSFFCRTCELGKSRRMSYKNMVGQKATDPLHTLHMDSLGKITPQGLYSPIGHKYALAVVDDATAYKWYFVQNSLTESKNSLSNYETTPIYCKKRTDGGTEFVNKVLENYCSRNGLVFQKSNVESQEENGSAERAHQTIMGKVRCALIGSGMAAKWWPEALKYMTAVNNRIPTARLKGKCPYEALYGNKPNGIELRIWGSTSYAPVPKLKRANPKLSERAI
ncbi:LOW QUALITY PROTEIN: Retrotransposon protein, Ty1-Copia subclass, partial [Phytophthora megakarya]